jgi:predicted nucleic acid-binding protein
VHKLILDASVVISWCDELEDLIVFESILHNGFAPVTTETVMEEVLSDGPHIERVKDESEIVQTDPAHREELSNRFLGLGSGEVSVLALGEKYESMDVGYSCVLDDGRARNVCNNLDLNLTGTLGVFRELVDVGALEFKQADALVSEMKANGTRLPKNHQQLIRPTAPSD